MIRLLAHVFLLMAVYGFWVSIYGAALLSLVMCLFMHYAGAWFAAQDRAYYKDPAHAQAEPSTSDALQAADSECMADKL